MISFPDTSFLCSFYREQVHSSRADAWMETRTTSLPVSTLLLLEFRQSTRFQVRLHRLDRTRGFAEREAQGILQNLQSDLTNGILELLPVDWPDVHQTAERLSATHTIARGHRFADILHVATAIHLAASEFLTFDENQRHLAEAEGLKVPVR